MNSSIPTHLLIIYILFCTFIVSCTTQPENLEKTAIKESKQVIVKSFQEILDSAHVEGTIVIYSDSDSIYYSNNFNKASLGQLPASTYKIPNSIIALETGIIASDSTICKWNGQPRGLEIWEQDLSLKDAFRYSCVPCYQEIARKIGTERMNNYLDRLEYPGMVVNDETLDIFWLQGASRISIMDQLEFLQRLYYSKLPIESKNEKIIKRMMVLDQNESYTFRGKTGWSITEGRNNGWFVGYLEGLDNVYFFALNIDDTPQTDMNTWPSLRRELITEAFNLLGIIDQL